MTTYISAEGLEKLKEEMVTRQKVTRKEIAERISDAKELGDLSENFEYHDAKEQQALNEGRVLQLEAMIVDAVIVEQQSGGDIIDLGSTFIVDLDGNQKTFELVGSSEADPISGKISNDSPLGKNFIGRKVGDDIEVQVPSGTKTYKIIEIK